MSRGGRTRRTNRKGIKLLCILSVVALALGGIYYFLLTHTVKTVYVEGNVHYTKEEIQDMVMEQFLLPVLTICGQADNEYSLYCVYERGGAFAGYGQNKGI